LANRKVMLRGRRVSFLLLGVLVFAGCGSASPLVIRVPLRPGPSVEAPVYHRNDRWVFRAATENDSPKEFTVLPPTEEISYRDAKLAENYYSQLFDETIWITVNYNRAEIKTFDFPLVAGKTWSYNYDGNGKISLRAAQVIVVGPTVQPVQTAAGKFNAIEIRRIETWRNGERTTTYFYSPETKSVIKLDADASGLEGDRHYEMELLRYGLGNQ